MLKNSVFIEMNTPGNDYMTGPSGTKKGRTAQIVVGVVGSVVALGLIGFIAWAIVDMMRKTSSETSLEPVAIPSKVSEKNFIKNDIKPILKKPREEEIIVEKINDVPVSENVTVEEQNENVVPEFLPLAEESEMATIDQ